MQEARSTSPITEITTIYPPKFDNASGIFLSTDIYLRVLFSPQVTGSFHFIPYWGAAPLRRAPQRLQAQPQAHFCSQEEHTHTHTQPVSTELTLLHHSTYTQNNTFSSIFAIVNFLAVLLPLFLIQMLLHSPG